MFHQQRNQPAAADNGFLAPVLSDFLALAFGLGLGFMIPAHSAVARADTREAQNKAPIAAGFDDWKNGTGSPDDHLADNATWTIAGNSLASRTYHGREDFLANVIRPFNARMSGRLIPDVRHIYADGDTVIVHFDAAGTARDHKPYRNSYAWFFTVRGKRMVDATAFYDSTASNDFWRRMRPDA
ncbi:nuclear transport factor 2 family protein [Enterobacteriales bacterium SAP-6]|uniref:Nuclear transport factor 2 family protein n=2 Tax=Acerihabitans arboris TaxID=2691583 RepID=A0A845SPB5_9GAMM|nr:nuclear transport factor 2 family protein [Acerihabitans arboris]